MLTWHLHACMHGNADFVPACMHQNAEELFFVTLSMLSMASGLSYRPISRHYSRCDALRVDHVKTQSTEGVGRRQG